MMQGSKSWINTHPYLYHYTAAVGFKGILKSNALRATYFADLNNSWEIHELRKRFAAALTSRLVPIVGELRRSSHQLNKTVSELGGNVGAAKQFAHSWVDSLYRSTFSVDAKAETYCCITSFCSHAIDQQYEQENGLLSQWRGYGTDGGFCLVFDARKLSAQLATERASYFYLHTDLRPVHYYIEGSPLTDEFDQLLQLSEDIMRSAIVGGQD